MPKKKIQKPLLRVDAPNGTGGHGQVPTTSNGLGGTHRPPENSQEFAEVINTYRSVFCGCYRGSGMTSEDKEEEGKGEDGDEEENSDNGGGGDMVECVESAVGGIKIDDCEDDENDEEIVEDGGKKVEMEEEVGGEKGVEVGEEVEAEDDDDDDEDDDDDDDEENNEEQEEGAEDNSHQRKRKACCCHEHGRAPVFLDKKARKKLNGFQWLNPAVRQRQLSMAGANKIIGVESSLDSSSGDHTASEISSSVFSSPKGSFDLDQEDAADETKATTSEKTMESSVTAGCGSSPRVSEHVLRYSLGKGFGLTGDDASTDQIDAADKNRKKDGFVSDKKMGVDSVKTIDKNVLDGVVNPSHYRLKVLPKQGIVHFNCGSSCQRKASPLSVNCANTHTSTRSSSPCNHSVLSAGVSGSPYNSASPLPFYDARVYNSSNYDDTMKTRESSFFSAVNELSTCSELQSKSREFEECRNIQKKPSQQFVDKSTNVIPLSDTYRSLTSTILRQVGSGGESASCECDVEHDIQDGRPERTDIYISSLCQGDPSDYESQSVIMNRTAPTEFEEVVVSTDKKGGVLACSKERFKTSNRKFSNSLSKSNTTSYQSTISRVSTTSTASSNKRNRETTHLQTNVAPAPSSYRRFVVKEILSKNGSKTCPGRIKRNNLAEHNRPSHHQSYGNLVTTRKRSSLTRFRHDLEYLHSNDPYVYKNKNYTIRDVLCVKRNIARPNKTQAQEFSFNKANLTISKHSIRSRDWSQSTGADSWSHQSVGRPMSHGPSSGRKALTFVRQGSKRKNTTPGDHVQ